MKSNSGARSLRQDRDNSEIIDGFSYFVDVVACKGEVEYVAIEENWQVVGKSEKKFLGKT